MKQLPITIANVQDWFPCPATENPFAGDPWWQMQQVGLVAALQMLRQLSDTPQRQQALLELRRAIDTAAGTLQMPTEDAIARRFAQTLAPYHQTPYPVVTAMLDLACVGPDDILFDLGSGDGRIVLAAAERLATAIGVEIDEALVIKARARVTPGLSAAFVHGDIASIDLSDATVITCYLLTDSMRVLEPRFRRLRRGTRIVSHGFAIRGWDPVATVTTEEGQVYLWIV